MPCAASIPVENADWILYPPVSPSISSTSPAKNRLEEEALPVLISMARPIAYPGWARHKGLEGLLVAVFEILEDGSVGQWQIVKSTGDELLDKAAVKAFLTWKFQPAMKNGRPVKSYIQIPINFELSEE